MSEELLVLESNTNKSGIEVNSEKTIKQAQLSVIMPVYNEVKTVLEVVDRVLSLQLDVDLIIVDDGSTDGTRETLLKIEDQRVKIVLHDENQGKGAAVRTGYKHATGEIVTIQDADLELNPAEIPALLQPIFEGTADVVYGSRFLFGFNHRSRLNGFANWFLSGLTNLLYGTRIRDMEACYKVFNTSLLTKFTLNANGFDFEPEITAKLSKLGLRIVELPVTYKPREFTDGKKIHWKDGFEAIYTLVKYRFID